MVVCYIVMVKQVHQAIATKAAFQSALRGELHKSGIIGTVTSELRRQVFDALNQSSHGGRLHQPNAYNLDQAAIRSLIMEYLTCDGLEQTASILASESYLDDNFLSRRDALKAYAVLKDSSIHAMLMRSRDDEKENRMNHLKSCYEDTTIHILLSHAATLSMDTTKVSISTQTTIPENGLRAREQLDRQLMMINEKYSKPQNRTNDYCNIEETMKAKLFSIQKECEIQAQKEMERKLKYFQETNLVSMQKAEEDKRQMERSQLQLKMKQEYDDKIHEFLKRQQEAKALLERKEREREMNQMKERQKMIHEMDRLAERKIKIKNELEFERKKLQIEEQRIQHVLMTAEAKLDYAEKKENAMRNDMEAEYNRIRSAAKQTFDDATDTARKQSDFYCKELKELNG